MGESRISIFILFSFSKMKDLIQKYCFYAKETLNRSTDVVTHHYYNLLQFNEYVSVKKGMLTNINDVAVSDCLDFIAYYRTTPIQYWPNKGKLPSQNTLCEKVKSLRVFFEYLNIVGLSTLNRQAIPKLKKTRDTIDMMKAVEYTTFIQAPLFYENKEIIQLRNQLLIEIPYTTWLRRSEVLRCTFEGFESPNRQFNILGKGGYIDAVFFTEELRWKVTYYKGKLAEFTKHKPIKNDLLFVGLDNKNRGRPLAPKYVNFLFQKYSKKLMEAWKITRPLKPHMERHAFATNCVFAGISQQATTKLMRHRDPKTTERYYHLNNDRLRGEFDKLG